VNASAPTAANRGRLVPVPSALPTAGNAAAAAAAAALCSR